MQALKIIDSYRQELTDNTIVICTYNQLPDMNEVDCIDIYYQSQYPEFEVIDVYIEPETFSGSTESYVGS